MIREENFETMSYKVTGDSCLDLTKEMKQNPHFQMVPLTLFFYYNAKSATCH